MTRFGDSDKAMHESAFLEHVYVRGRLSLLPAEFVLELGVKSAPCTLCIAQQIDQ